MTEETGRPAGRSKRWIGGSVLFLSLNFAASVTWGLVWDALRVDRPSAWPPMTETTLWVGLGAFNLALAALLLSSRPRQPIHWLGALWFAANGIGVSLRQFGTLVAAVDWSAWQGAAWWIGQMIEFVTFLPILLIPLTFPRRLVTERTMWIIAAAASALWLLYWWLTPAPALHLTGHDPLIVQTALATSGLGTLVAYAGLLLGCLIFVDGYLTAPTRIRREQSRYLLAGYLVTVATFATLGNPLWGAPNPLPLNFRVEVVVDWIRILLATASVAAVFIAIAVSRVRRRREQATDALFGGDLFVLGVAAFGLAYPLWAADPSLVWMLLRPLLFTYGILRFQLLDVELRERAWLIAVAALSGMTVVYLSAADAARAAGADVSTAVGLALLAMMAIGLAFAWPVGRRLLVSYANDTRGRDRDIYRAALEHAATTSGSGAPVANRFLHDLRTKIGISEREHAMLELELQAARGASVEVEGGGTFLGKYKVDRLLGEGGFSRTWLAHDTKLGRSVVLKVTRWDTEKEARRALREARILARLGHPNTVTMHDLEEVGGDLIMVLEYLPQGSLADRLRKGRLPVKDVLTIADDVLAGLAAAHSEGIVHRDVKPANILLTSSGRAKVADFGVAHGADTGTMTGFAFTATTPGTLHYMSPEQARGAGADARSDVYSVGVMLYEMVAGVPYLDFAGLTDFDARMAILEAEPRLPLPRVPKPVNDVLARALAKDPAQRPKDAAALRKALQSAQNGDGT